MSNIQSELEFLMNSGLYEKYKHKQETEDTSLFVNDKKFYKKRIIQLTKDLFKPNQHSDSINLLCNDYIKTCINHLKMKDKMDIIQTEYSNLNNNEPDNKPETDISLGQIDNEFIKSVLNKPSSNNLDDYVIKTINEPEKPPHLPKKKIVNLTNPELMNKGVKKKKKKKESN
jgi:hypothetical protein